MKKGSNGLSKANLIRDGLWPWKVEPVVVASLFFILLSSLCVVVIDDRAESSENLGFSISEALVFDSADGKFPSVWISRFPQNR